MAMAESLDDSRYVNNRNNALVGFVAFALIAFEHRIGLFIIDKKFCFRIPAKLTSKSNRDISEMAGRNAPMLTFDI